MSFTHTDVGKKIYSRRKETVERSFADSKELFGLRYCRMRGLSKVAEQCLLTAAAQNMKKNSNVLWMIHCYFFRLYVNSWGKKTQKMKRNKGSGRKVAALNYENI